MTNLEDAERELDRLSKELPLAIKTQKFAVGTEKSLLAKYIVKYVRDGNKPALATTLAQADPGYHDERKQLMDLFELAERTIQQHKQAYTHWDTARSLLSIAKAQLPAAYSYAKNFGE